MVKFMQGFPSELCLLFELFCLLDLKSNRVLFSLGQKKNLGYGGMVGTWSTEANLVTYRTSQRCNVGLSFVRHLWYYVFCRCSPSFFEEERRALHERRDKIRLLQQRKLGDLSNLKDLPEEIPLHLVIGTKVTGNGYENCFMQMYRLDNFLYDNGQFNCFLYASPLKVEGPC